MPARITPTREMRTAHHEAGHVVIAFFSSRLPRVKRVTIVPDPTTGTLGHWLPWPTPSFRPDLNEDARTTLRILQEIPALLAGTVAERRLAGRYNHVGAQSDREKALDLALYICGP